MTNELTEFSTAQQRGTSEAIVTRFRSATDTIPAGHSPIGHILRAIREFKLPGIDDLRNLYHTDRAAYKERKKSALPAVIFGGKYSGRKETTLETHSGFIVLDLDNLEGMLSELREEIERDRYTYACFLSPSGAGLKIIVRIEATDGKEHRRCFAGLESYFLEQFTQQLDKSGSDPNRLCFLSYDPALYINESAEVFPLPSAVKRAVVPKSSAETAPAPKSLSIVKGGIQAGDVDKVRSVLSHIPPRPDYAEWLRVIGATWSVLSEADALAVLQEWSPEEKPGEYLEKLNSGLQKVGAGTLVHIAKEHGYAPERTTTRQATASHPAPIDSETADDPTSKATETEEPAEQTTGKLAPVVTYLRQCYDFRHNIVLQRCEISKKGKEEWSVLDDRRVNDLWRELDKAEKAIAAANLDRLLNSGFATDFDPFVTYFDDLLPWDGVDYIGQLAGTVTVGDDQQERFRAMLERFLLGLVKCATTDGVANHLCLIFTGRQAVGKTTWLSRLAPDALQGYVHSGSFIAGDKDSSLRLATKLLLNLDELEGMGRGDLKSLKSHITASTVSERLPYGHRDVLLQRRASFCGSLNSAEFLQDETGSRRFLVFEALEMTNAGRHGVDMDKVYAQAVALLARGERWWLEGEEIETLTNHNRDYTVTGYIDELLLARYSPAKKGDPGMITYTTTEIAKAIMSGEPSNAPSLDKVTQALGRALTHHGFEKVSKKTDGKPRKVWMVRPAGRHGG